MIPFSKHKQGLLLRVSRDEQEFESQLERARKSFARDGLEFPPAEHVYAEKESGFRRDALSRRTRLRDLINDLTSKRLHGFRAVRVSRYFRNTRLGLELYDTLHQLGVKVIFIEGASVDIFTREGRQWFLGKLASAEAESLETSARVQDGKTAVHMQGRTNASKAGFGAKKKGGVLRWVKPGALIVRDALTWFHDTPNATRPMVCEMLYEKYKINITPQTVGRWIKAPRYYGLVRHTPAPYGRQHADAKAIAGSKLRKAKWKPLVKRSWYAENIAKLAGNASQGKGIHHRKKHEYVFGGGDLLRCTHCGGSMFGEMRLLRAKPRRKYTPGYLCTNAKRLHTCIAKGRSVYESELVQQVGQLIGQIHLPDHWVEDIVTHGRKLRAERQIERDDTRNARRALQARRDQAALDWSRKKISRDAFDALASALDAEEVALTSNVTSTAMVTPDAPSAESIRKMMESVYALSASWRKMTATSRRKMINEMFAALHVNVFSKRIVRLDARAEWGVLLGAVPAFRRVGDTDVFDVVVGEPDTWRLIRAALGELGQAPAYVLAARPGLTADAVRLALRGMHDAGIVDVCDRVRLPHGWKMTNVWRLI